MSTIQKKNHSLVDERYSDAIEETYAAIGEKIPRDKFIACGDAYAKRYSDAIEETCAAIGEKIPRDKFIACGDAYLEKSSLGDDA